MHLDDLLLRRTRLGMLLEKGGEQLFEDLGRLFSDVSGWDGLHWEQEVTRYRGIWKHYYSLPENGPVDGNG